MTGAGTDTSPRPTADVARRLTGSAVLVGVLLVILIVGAIRGHIVAGQPAAQPVKGPPQVGDCVTENPDYSGANLNHLPALRTEPCSGLRYGDVAFVISAFAEPTSDVLPFQDPCSAHVDRYLGAPPLPTDGSFAPFVLPGLALLGPDARQRAAGQHWAACMVYVHLSLDNPEAVTVDHSLRGAWQRTDDSRLFAICIDDPAAMWTASCRSPHRYEMLGMAVGTPSISQQTLESACRHIVVQALGSSAALDRGVLGSQVLAARFESDSGTWITGPDAVTVAGEYSNMCLATPTDSSRRLTAPLRGLGDAAVPLS